MLNGTSRSHTFFRSRPVVTIFAGRTRTTMRRIHLARSPGTLPKDLTKLKTKTAAQAIMPAVCPLRIRLLPFTGGALS